MFRNAGTSEIPQPHSMVVNRAGKRFGDEAFLPEAPERTAPFRCAHACLSQPAVLLGLRQPICREILGQRPADRRRCRISSPRRRRPRRSPRRSASMAPASFRRSRGSTASSQPEPMRISVADERTGAAITAATSPAPTPISAPSRRRRSTASARSVGHVVGRDPDQYARPGHGPAQSPDSRPLCARELHRGRRVRRRLSGRASLSARA